ncbi:replication protein A, subunit RPA32 [Thozetella sp. PMI_491]|nr:replication protein A, subunit RPA32 [Thozetella sp. PMI_491]
MSGSQQGSQGGGAGGGKSDESLRPVTIKQLLDCEEAYPGAEILIDGVPISQVTIVGQVRAVNKQATNITFKLDDGTAEIDVKKWIDPEKADEADPGFALDSYIRVWGRLKSFNGKRHVGAHFLRAIEDFNEVNYHLVESTYVHLYFTKGLPAPAGANGAKGGDEDSMFVDGYGGGGGGADAKVNNCSRTAKAMFNFLLNTPGGNEGVNLNLIANGAKMQVRDVMAAADELLGQGLIYTTIDDETWAVLDY